MPHPFALVCFRLRSGGAADPTGDAANAELLRRLNASGALYLTHTRVGDRFVLRFCVGAPQTTQDHVRAAWARIQASAADLG